MQIKFLAGKKADVDILNVVFQILVASFMLISILIFINSSTNKEIIEQKNLVKELALIIDSAPNNTLLEVFSPYEIAFNPVSQNLSVGKYSYFFFRNDATLTSLGGTGNYKIQIK